MSRCSSSTPPATRLTRCSWPACRGCGVVLVLLAAAAVHTAGELLFVAASWGLSIPLMPPDSPGEYQGVFATGEATALMAAPALMTTLVADWGQPGWLVLAAIFL